MKLNIPDTALDNKAKDEKIEIINDDEKIEKIKVIKGYGEVINLNNNIIERIDFKDKTYINRIYNNISEIIDDDLLEMKESIRKIGLINIIYLLKKEKNDKNKDLIIVSGLRRLVALKKIIEDGEKINFAERVVIFKGEIANEKLEEISIDENLQRKNLTILEQSYKFNKEAKKKKKGLKEILEENNISKKHFYRIKKAMDYPKELKEILEEIGVAKAEIINNIIKLDEKNKGITEIIKGIKNLTREELKIKLRETKKENKNEAGKIIYKIINNKIVININLKETEEFLKVYNEFKNNIEKL